jgi:hypothetical protein
MEQPGMYWTDRDAWMRWHIALNTSPAPSTGYLIRATNPGKTFAAKR